MSDGVQFEQVIDNAKEFLCRIPYSLASLPLTLRLGGFDMELALSAVTGELVSRFISFLMNKYSSPPCSEEKLLERLQQLLLRVRMVVEEADGRYITNSGMLAQLKMLADAMYRGYCVLDTFKYRLHEKNPMEDEVSNSSALSFAFPLKRSRTIAGTARKDEARYRELRAALESLEIAVANMPEFVVLLGGCERISRIPYDAYLYTDNFMFGRHTEKQKLLNFMLQHNSPAGAPAVLPIIGSFAVGKKTLVAHVCNDERVCSNFSSILHCNEDNFLWKAVTRRPRSGRTLVIVEFVSYVNDMDFTKFYSSVASFDQGSKVVILSRLKRTEEFGTVNPIFLSNHSYDEFSYLFKTLAFGSANPVEHPRLVPIAEEFAMDLQLRGSLVVANALANVLRRNLNAHFWLCILNRCRRVVERNFSEYGECPKLLFERGHRIDMTNFAVSPAAPWYLIPCTGIRNTFEVPMRKELPKVTFGELLIHPNARPKGEFNLISWESKIPPYTSFVHFVPSCVQDMPEDTPLSGRKRRGVPF